MFLQIFFDGEDIFEFFRSLNSTEIQYGFASYYSVIKSQVADRRRECTTISDIRRAFCIYVGTLSWNSQHLIDQNQILLVKSNWNNCFFCLSHSFKRLFSNTFVFQNKVVLFLLISIAQFSLTLPTNACIAHSLETVEETSNHHHNSPRKNGEGEGEEKLRKIHIHLIT